MTSTNQLTWLQLWARLETNCEAPDPSDVALQRDFVRIAAVAGVLSRHQERAANAEDLSALILLLLAYWSYANYCAKQRTFNAFPIKTRAEATLASIPVPAWLFGLLALTLTSDKTNTPPHRAV